MTKKDRIISTVITILLSVFVCIPMFSFKPYSKEKPEDLYRVYLFGKSIGVIKSKQKLENYINDDQKELREKYNVDTVYAPKSLYVSKIQSYNENIILEKEVYETIKENENFTIKGYVVTIEGLTEEDEDVVFNVLDKSHFENAITSVVKAFVPSDELDVFLSGEEVIIKGTGSKIEDLYIKENIKIREAFIPSNETIFVSEKDITKYLLFGDNIKEKYYIVKAGDTIESIAEDNKLAVEELLVVNQDLKSKNNILSIGEEISVALISPIITVVEEEHSVEEKVIAFTTQIEYDSTMIWGASKIKQEGKNGLQIVTQKLKKENGEIVNALIAGTEVVEEAINSIKVVGTMSNVVINPEDIPDSGDWYWPTRTPYIITSPYGWRWGTLHDGTDISGTGHGSPIYAANNGVATKVWYDGIGGNQVIIAHSGNIYTWYAHMASTLVKAGQTITRGQKIGTMGCTGSACTGTHLHFASYLGRPGAGGKSFNAMTLYR